jgi:hypothetical protein
MSYRQLTVTKNEQNGAIVFLSDGGRYLIQAEHHSIAAGWPVGQSIHVLSVDYPPNGFELRVEPSSSPAVAILVA